MKEIIFLNYHWPYYGQINIISPRQGGSGTPQYIMETVIPSQIYPGIRDSCDWCSLPPLVELQPPSFDALLRFPTFPHICLFVLLKFYSSVALTSIAVGNILAGMCFTLFSKKKLKFNLSIFPGAPGSLTLTYCLDVWLRVHWHTILSKRKATLENLSFFWRRV